MARRVKQLPLLGAYTSDESSSTDEDEAAPLRHRKHLKSRKVHTADTQVLRCVPWPHEFVFMGNGQPAIYENLSVPLFHQWLCESDGCQEAAPQSLDGYSSHGADGEIYIWEAVRAYHAVWLQQLEQCHASWAY